MTAKTRTRAPSRPRHNGSSPLQVNVRNELARPYQGYTATELAAIALELRVRQRFAISEIARHLYGDSIAGPSRVEQLLADQPRWVRFGAGAMDRISEQDYSVRL